MSLALNRLYDKTVDRNSPSSHHLSHSNIQRIYTTMQTKQLNLLLEAHRSKFNIIANLKCSLVLSSLFPFIPRVTINTKLLTVKRVLLSLSVDAVGDSWFEDKGLPPPDKDQSHDWRPKNSPQKSHQQGNRKWERTDRLHLYYGWTRNCRCSQKDQTHHSSWTERDTHTKIPNAAQKLRFNDTLLSVLLNANTIQLQQHQRLTLSKTITKRKLKSNFFFYLWQITTSMRDCETLTLTWRRSQAIVTLLVSDALSNTGRAVTL